MSVPENCGVGLSKLQGSLYKTGRTGFTARNDFNNFGDLIKWVYISTPPQQRRLRRLLLRVANRHLRLHHSPGSSTASSFYFTVISDRSPGKSLALWLVHQLRPPNLKIGDLQNRLVEVSFLRQREDVRVARHRHSKKSATLELEEILVNEFQ